MKRTRAWRRYKNYTKAKRKRDIDASYQSGSIYWHPWYNNLHQYSKNKIHCSCPMCSAKTNNKNSKNAFYAPHWNPLLSDLRKMMAMDDDELENFIRYHRNRHNRRKTNW